jgi:hypothetical protein
MRADHGAMNRRNALHDPGKAHPNTRTTIRSDAPPALADLALIDGPTAAAAACMSISLWRELVAAGKAPAPAFRRPRCTRWRLADVRGWLVEYAAQGDTVQGREAARTARATAAAASQAARTKRKPAAAASKAA